MFGDLGVSQQTKKHLYNLGTTSAQRLRRWSYIAQMLCKCFVFAGLALTPKCVGHIFKSNCLPYCRVYTITPGML